MPSLQFSSKAGAKEEVPLGKIVGVARNYVAHAREMQSAPPESPLLFLKPASSYLPDGGTVRIPAMSERVDHEVELAVVLGRTARRVPASRWKDFVLGYGVLVDFTARDLQEDAKRKGYPWTISKGFDTFTPISVIVPRDRVNDPQALDLHLLVNGEMRQQGHTKDMIFPVPQLVEFITSAMTLERGDVIATGTPEGVGPVKRGDQVEARIPGLVNLKVRVDEEAKRR